MDDVGVLGLNMELQDLAVVSQKLLLRLDAAATELVLETFKVLEEGSMASPSMQADLGALACVQMCVSYLDKVAGPLEADPSAAAMASLAPSQSAVE